jgi:hypothetical protein
MMAVQAKKPVQVYLDEKRAIALSRLATTLGTSQSEVLRQGIDLLAQQILPVADEPLLALIGLAGTDTDSPGDLAERHDEYLIQAQEEDDGKR